MSNIDTVREQLSNLISSDEFNNKSSEELSDILYNLSLALATNNKSLKNCIGIRILSLNEYNKYISNGTADGSITKNDNNVWHNSCSFIKQAYLYSDNINERTSLSTNSFPGGFTDRTAISLASNSTTQTNVYSEQFSNNSKNITSSKMLLQIGLYVNHWHSGFGGLNSKTLDNKDLNKNKTDTKIASSISCSQGNNYSVVSETIQYSIIYAFRPCFAIVDNNKSSGSYY